MADAYASDELDDRSNDARRHIQGKVSDGSIFLDNSANLDSFFAAERIVSAVMLDSDHGLIPDFQMLRGELEGANISISNFMRFSKVPKDYQSKLNFRSKSASLTGTSAHEFLGYLDFNFIEKIERDLISELNKDQDFCFFQFKLGRFTRHLPEVVEVRKLRSDGFNLYPLEWFIDIGLSYHILSNREVRDSWLKRIKASLNTLKHDILEFFSASRAFGKMCCSFGDGGKLISKTITFDCETGTEEIVMPDLYVLTERPLQRFFGRPTPLEFEESFRKKKPRLFWRGSTTGALGNRDIEGLRNNLRVKACLLSKEMPASQSDMRIVFITGIKPEYKMDADKFLVDCGIKGDQVPESEFAKSQMYIDLQGNVAAWGTYRKYLSGCVVLRPPSKRHLLYYDLLVPWVHFIPLDADLSDMSTKVDWVINHQGQAAQIAFAGRNALIDYISGLSKDIQRAFRDGFEIMDPVSPRAR